MTKTIVTLLASTLLAGCHSIFGSHAKLEVRPIGGEQTAASAAIALEEGRQHLVGGDVGSAIVAFRVATLDRETVAPAYNGLGVAYAMLGRGDLAERYFQRAVAENPDDPRFAGNLAKFYRSREAALAKVEAAAAPIVVARTDAASTAPAAPLAAAATLVERVIRAGASIVRVSAPAPAAAATRVSRQEIVIRTQPAVPALAAADPRRRNPRFVAAQARPLPESYPVRIKLPKLAGR